MFWFPRCNRYGSFKDGLSLYGPFYSRNFPNQERVFIWLTQIYHLPSEFLSHSSMTQIFYLSFLVLTGEKNCSAENATNSKLMYVTTLILWTQIWKLGRGVKRKEGWKQTRTLLVLIHDNNHSQIFQEHREELHEENDICTGPILMRKERQLQAVGRVQTITTKRWGGNTELISLVSKVAHVHCKGKSINYGRKKKKKKISLK